ncbi:MAG: restriction endonuclease subunit S [Microcystis sp.]|nr:hypothetical protein [Microcystis aeruginosa F13-15]
MTTGKLDSNAAIQYGEYPFFTCARETYKINNYAFDTEAVLLGGNNANGIFPLKYYYGKFNAYQRTYIIESIDQNILLTRYLFYALKPALSHFQNASIGATTQYLTKSILDNFKIKVPDLNSQKAIVNILSKYDDLIENNRRRIELLERSARLLYKEWFVRLRFPGHEHTPIIDGIPEGWEKRPLSQICYDVRDSIKPQDLSPDMAYIGLEHMPRRSIALSEWGNAEDLQSNKFKFKKDDIIFGKIRPYFHKVGVACIDGVTSSDAIVIRSYNPQMYYYCLMLGEHLTFAISRNA